MIARARALLEALSRFMARVWLTVLYFTVVLPFGIVARLRISRRGPVALTWRARADSAGNLREAGRQF
jgi:hypothetical protein